MSKLNKSIIPNCLINLYFLQRFFLKERNKYFSPNLLSNILTYHNTTSFLQYKKRIKKILIIFRAYARRGENIEYIYSGKSRADSMNNLKQACRRKQIFFQF